jgi:hypothetical protein
LIKMKSLLWNCIIFVEPEPRQTRIFLAQNIGIDDIIVVEPYHLRRVGAVTRFKLARRDVGVKLRRYL